VGCSGQHTDAESGLIYSINRYYDRATGQFLTVDPSIAVTAAPYGYASEDPTNRTDPTGLDDTYTDYTLQAWDPCLILWPEYQQYVKAGLDHNVEAGQARTYRAQTQALPLSSWRSTSALRS
jgi:RHS repeat-associated protein